MKRAILFIDGGYLSKLQKNHFNLTRIDFRRFAPWAFFGYRAEATYYYDCLPYMPDNPTKDDKKRYDDRQRFFNTIRRFPNFEVRLGRLEYRGDDKLTGKPIFVQKRVDLMLGLDLALQAINPNIAAIVIVCGDSDLIPALEFANSKGKMVRLIHGPKSTFHEDLRSAASQSQEITWTVVLSCKYTPHP